MKSLAVSCVSANVYLYHSSKDLKVLFKQWINFDNALWGMQAILSLLVEGSWKHKVFNTGRINYKLEQLIQFTTSLFKLNQTHKYRP